MPSLGVGSPDHLIPCDSPSRGECFRGTFLLGVAPRPSKSGLSGGLFFKTFLALNMYVVIFLQWSLLELPFYPGCWLVSTRIDMHHFSAPKPSFVTCDCYCARGVTTHDIYRKSLIDWSWIIDHYRGARIIRQLWKKPMLPSRKMVWAEVQQACRFIP